MPRYLVVILISIVSTACWSIEDSASICPIISELENNWAKIRYQTPAKQRTTAFEQMLISLREMPRQCRAIANYQIIEAMIKGSMIKQQGSRLSSLKKIKSLKRLLEKSISNNPAAMNGLGWTLLGLLYDKSPGWPLSIGDDKKADNAYLKGLEYNPAGIDANFYYGDFLRRNHLIQQAQHYLLKARQAKQQAGHEIAYQGRLKDVQRSLTKATRNQ
jgi:tetratricopeptide (TPR) repeat protein